jgi:mannose/fructose/N-acetylgalactosamine-specific phosphotransferase system component IIC
MSDGLTILILALFAGAVAVDTTAVLQLMISQPVVAATVAGLIVGEPATGLMVGLTLQLVWAGVLPVGGAGFPDAGVAAVVGAGTAGLLVTRGHPAGWAVASGLLVALAVGSLGRLIVARLRRWNVSVAERAREAVLAGDLGGLRRAVLRAIGLRFSLAVALSALCVGLALLIASAILPAAGASTYPALIWAAPIAVGSAVAVSRGWGERISVAAGLAAGALLVAFM